MRTSALKTRKNVAAFFLINGFAVGYMAGAAGDYTPLWFDVLTVLMVGFIVFVTAREWQALRSPNSADEIPHPAQTGAVEKTSRKPPGS